MSAATLPTLPSLEPPHDAGVHISVDDHVGFCGSPKKHGHRAGWNGESHCPRCGAPICPTCLAMARALRHGGITP